MAEQSPEQKVAVLAKTSYRALLGTAPVDVRQPWSTCFLRRLSKT